MTSCFLIGKDTSVCVRFFTSDCQALDPWIKTFSQAPCHVHCHTHLDSLYDKPSYEDELREWLASSSCASAVMLIDSRMNQALDTTFLTLCERAKSQGVFIGIFIEEEKNINSRLLSVKPNWKLAITAALPVIQKKVNEILGVVRFSPFTAVS